ncbi:hypothetical protein [Leifsonia aquatica]|uniref:hypothetical protein n=1 Tax=Leifsonia aquatica TaxID=144185 RepID=UPI0004682AFA|nr:hypothetical protein [Leifsonia aquatica]
MAKGQTFEKVTAADVAAAQVALDEGRERLEQLHNAFVDGRGEWQDYIDQKAVIEFAEAQVLRVAADKRKYDEQVRQVALADLREEIDAYSLKSGDVLLEGFEAVESALGAFRKLFDDRNAVVRKWSQSMKDLDVPLLDVTRLVPPASEHGLGWRDGAGDMSIQAGERQFQLIFPDRYLADLFNGASHLDVLKTELKEIDHELPGYPDDALFFRKHDGALFVTSPSSPFSPEIMQRDGLEQITREEALNG